MWFPPSVSCPRRSTSCSCSKKPGVGESLELPQLLWDRGSHHLAGLGRSCKGLLDPTSFHPVSSGFSQWGWDSCSSQSPWGRIWLRAECTHDRSTVTTRPVPSCVMPVC